MAFEHALRSDVLSIERLSVAYGEKETVCDVSLTVGARQIVGLVGESGAGKSTVLRSVVRLTPVQAAITGGTIVFDGKNLAALPESELSGIRGKRIATIFQNPGSSLDPSMRVGKQIVEVIRQHAEATARQATMRSIDLLDRMGLPDPEALSRSYPFELSGGMQQRVSIALAMAFEPDLLLADEPTSALDSTTQLSIMKELIGLRDEHGTSILLVTHNIGLAYHTCDELHVMQDGRVVERGSAEQVIKSPRAALTRKLIDAVPQVI